MQFGVLGRGLDKGCFEIETINPRDFATDKHRTVDDTPYGGGPGMVLKVEPLVEATESVKLQGESRRILLTPSGSLFNQTKAKEYSQLDHLVFICGRYEGIDERVKTCLEPEEVSVGDYVLTGGELAALSVADATCRMIEGVLGSYASTIEESFSENVSGLEYPQYTRPQSYRNLDVPEVLLNGNHEKIDAWRQNLAGVITKQKRPDLVKPA